MASGVFGLLLAGSMAGTAYASRDLVQDRRVTLQQAETMLRKAQNSDGFPLVVNDLVLKELNRFIGTPEGRVYMQNALARMEGYRSLVQSKLKQYQLPPELMAIPVIESAYQNLPQDNNVGHGAGLWMFIASTAKTFGLHVDADTDERLQPQTETDAAMRYLLSNRLRFNDWLLAIFAYNVGESSVEQAIEQQHTRDVWTLIRNGVENDTAYLARVMAAVLIMKNPESVQ